MQDNDKDKNKNISEDFLDYMFGSIIEKIFIAIIAVIVMIFLSIFFIGKIFGFAGLLIVLFLIFTPVGHTLLILFMNIFIPNNKNKS